MKINLTAPLNQLGYGAVSLNILKSLVACGHEVSLWPIGQIDAEPHNHEVLRACLKNAQLYDSAAPSLRIFHQFDLAQHVGHGVHVGFPIFELNKFTDVEKHHLLTQDKIFVASTWAKDVLIANQIPNDAITVAPFAVDTEVFKPSSDSSPREVPTIFLTVGKWEVRKSHYEILDAFNKAFTQDDDVQLWACCQNPAVPQGRGEAYNREWNTLYQSSNLSNKVRLLPRLATSAEVAEIMARADCGVFPARAEGWNMELAEMLAAGKQCIATSYAGHSEYANSENCLLVQIDKLESAFDGVYFHGQGEWAAIEDRQIEQIVSHMRSVHAAKRAGTLALNQAGIDTFKNKFT